MSSPAITVTNLNRRHSLNAPFIKKLISKLLIKEKKGFELEVVFLDNQAMRSINRRYRGEDRPTDVLSFKMGMEVFGVKDRLLGEVLVSSDMASRNAKIFQATFEKEIMRYVVHGILHLFGHKDRTKDEKLRMSGKENRILKNLCRNEDLSRVSTPR